MTDKDKIYLKIDYNGRYLRSIHISGANEEDDVQLLLFTNFIRTVTYVGDVKCIHSF